VTGIETPAAGSSAATAASIGGVPARSGDDGAAARSVDARRDMRRLVGSLAAVVGPLTLLTALAYYFGWRRERAFAGYFGIDPSMLVLSTNDYVLRSVDSLFAPCAALLLLGLAFVCARVLLAGRTPSRRLTVAAGIAGVAVLAVGVALAAGHGVSARLVYLQALAPAVAAVLIAYALERTGRGRPADLRGLHYLTISVVLVSLFWATAEYANSRGTHEAQSLAADLSVDPSVTIFSKQNLNIDPRSYGTDTTCPAVRTLTRPHTDYPFVYRGFTLLLRNGGDYFLTPTPAGGTWGPLREPILIVPDDDTIRVELERGDDYPVQPLEQTISGALPVFTC